MKKKQTITLLLLFTFSLVFSGTSQGQGFNPKKGFQQVNFGIGASNYGVPLYVGMDFGLGEKFTIGPRLNYSNYSTNGYRYNIFNIIFRADYHWGAHIDGIVDDLDFYGGMSLGYSNWNSSFDGNNPNEVKGSHAYAALQVGVRYYFNRVWAVNGEISGGSISGIEIGVSAKLN